MTMYKTIIDIFSTFGRDILTEQRFVNILADYRAYPDKATKK